MSDQALLVERSRVYHRAVTDKWGIVRAACGADQWWRNRSAGVERANVLVAPGPWIGLPPCQRPECYGCPR